MITRRAIAAQGRIRRGVNRRPRERDRAVSNRGVRRGRDTGGRELALVVHRTVRLNAQKGVDCRYGKRDVGHVRRQRRQGCAVVVGIEAPAQRLGVGPVGQQQLGIGFHVGVHRGQLLVVEGAPGGESARLEARVDPWPQSSEPFGRR